MIAQIDILANGNDKIVPQLLFFAVIVVLSIVSSIAKKIKESQEKQRPLISSEPPRPPSSKYNSDQKPRPATPAGVSAREILSRAKQASANPQTIRQLRGEAKPSKYHPSQYQPKSQMPSESYMSADAILIPDKPRAVVSKKIKKDTAKISNVARRHLHAQVEARHIKAATDVTNVIAAKTTETDIKDVVPVSGIHELISNPDAFRKAFVVHEILLTPIALR